MTSLLTTMLCAAAFGLPQAPIDDASTAVELVETVAAPGSGESSAPSCGNQCGRHSGSCACDCCDCPDRSEDEIWLVSCRELPCLSCCDQQPGEDLGAGLRYWQYNHACGSWEKTTAAELGPTSMPTVVWIHGHRTDDEEAFRIGLMFYRELLRCHDPALPIRFVIWSWPSAKELKRPVQDARLVSSRTDAVATRLAWQLHQLNRHPAANGDQPVSLVGFSSGCRVTAGALHMLAGGQLCCQTLDLAPDEYQRRYRVALLAAGIESCWLQPGQKFGRALDSVEHALLLNNYCDWVLKRYGKLTCHCWRRGPQAIGYMGLTFTSDMAKYRDRVEQFNAAVYIGRQHAWRAYAYTPALMNMIRGQTLPAAEPITDSTP